MSRPPTLAEAISATLAVPEFMDNWRRLNGSTLGLDVRTSLDRMIDAATGHVPQPSDAEIKELFEFIRDYIWEPCVAQCFIEAKSPEELEAMRESFEAWNHE